MATERVELGLVEFRTPSWELFSKYFPSKVGGQPAWLSLSNLPDRTSITCSICKNPLTFLLQIYADKPEISSAYHRTIFIFFCSSGKCCQHVSGNSFVVLRSQLPQINKFYSEHDPIYGEKSSDEPSARQYQLICNVCGCLACMKCKSCSDSDYCCEDHRLLDWDMGHNVACGKKKAIEASSKRNNLHLLPEFDIVMVSEPSLPVLLQKSDSVKMEEYRQYMQSPRAPTELQDVPFEDFNVVLKKDKAFNKFKKRIELEPEQVLRYSIKGSPPLWVSSQCLPKPNDIPDCSCGSKRVFEFQVMPQLLNHLSLDAVGDSVDWGTLAIYTCANSCELGTESYTTEFLWKQFFSD